MEFSYDPEILPKIEIGGTEMPNESPEAITLALAKILKENNLSYRMIANDVMLIEPISDQLDLSAGIHRIEIRDAESKTILPYAYIYCPTSNDALVADSLGILHVPQAFGDDTDSLIFSFVSYQDLKLHRNSLKTHKSIELKRADLRIEQIEVIVRPFALNKTDQSGAEYYETGRFDHYYRIAGASLFPSDPISQLEWLPGLSFSSNRASIYFRGYSNDPMFYYDEIPVFRSDHFYSFISNANGLYYDRASVFANNLPIEKNRFCGGLINLSSNAGDKEYSLNVQLGNLMSSAAGVINIGKTAKLHIAGRKSYFQSLFDDNSTQSLVIPLNSEQKAKPFPTVSNPNANFSDINAAFESSTGKMDFKISFLHAEDDQSIISITEIKGPQNTNSPKFDYNSEHSSDSRTIGGSIQLGIRLKAHNKLELLASRGYWETKSDIEHLITGPANDRLRILNLANNLDQSEYKFAFTNDSKRDASWKVGLMYTDVASDLNIKSKEGELLSYGASRPSVILFGEKNWAISNKWSAHTSISFLTEENSFRTLPQASLTYKTRKHLKLNATWGLSSQAHSDILFVNPFEENLSVFSVGGEGPIEKMTSSKTSVGLEYRKDWFEIDLEFYYSYIDGVNSLSPKFIGRENDENTPPEYRIQKGESRSAGLNLKSCVTARNWSFLSSYSYTNADNRFDRIFRGDWYTSPFEQKHQITGILTFELKNHRLGISNSFKSGTTYNNLSDLSEEQDRDDSRAEDLADQLPNYNSLDFNYEYKLPLSKSDIRLQFSVLNVLNRRNISSRSQLDVLKFSDQNNILLSQEAEFLPRTYQVSLLASFFKR